MNPQNQLFRLIRATSGGECSFVRLDGVFQNVRGIHPEDGSTNMLLPARPGQLITR
jgi:hypothetical protein